MHSIFIPWDKKNRDPNTVITMESYRIAGKFIGPSLKRHYTYDISPILVEKIESIIQDTYTYQIAIAPRNSHAIKMISGSDFYVIGITLWFENLQDVLMFKLSHV